MHFVEEGSDRQASTLLRMMAVAVITIIVMTIWNVNGMLHVGDYCQNQMLMTLELF